MLERAMLFLLGGGGYLAIELAWRGASHWTMFLAGGICLCVLQALAVRPVCLPLAAGAGAAAVSGLEVCIGLACREVLHIVVWDYSAEWGNLQGWSARATACTGFCCAAGSSWCCGWRGGLLCVPFIGHEAPVRGVKVQILGLLMRYPGNRKRERRTYHDPAVQVCRRPRRSLFGAGGVLFSADTMQEAWEELSA